jgi:hypothetical protein
MEEIIGTLISIGVGVIRKKLKDNPEKKNIGKTDLYESIFAQHLSGRQIKNLLYRLDRYKDKNGWILIMEQAYEKRAMVKELVSKKGQYYDSLDLNTFTTKESKKRAFKEQINKLNFEYEVLARKLPLDLRRLAKIWPTREH